MLRNVLVQVVKPVLPDILNEVLSLNAQELVGEHVPDRGCLSSMKS